MESLEDRIMAFLKRQKRGAMAGYLSEKLGAPTAEIYKALRKLQAQGKIDERYPFAHEGPPDDEKDEQKK